MLVTREGGSFCRVVIMVTTGFAGLQAKKVWIWGLSVWVMCLVLAASGWPGQALASGPLVLADSQPRILLSGRVAGELDISNYLEVLPSADPALDLQAVLAGDLPFQPVDNNGIATASGAKLYWIRGSMSRSLADMSGPANWLLLLENTRIRQAQLYVRLSNGQPVADRSAPYQAVDQVQGERYQQFPLTLAPDSTLDFYLRLQTDGLFSIPVKVWSRDAYLLNKRSELPIWGLLFGAISALTLYNLFIYLSLRERAYLQLSLFLLSTLLLTLAREGFLSTGFTRSPLIGGRFEAVAEFVTLALAILFTRSYLNTARY